VSAIVVDCGADCERCGRRVIAGSRGQLDLIKNSGGSEAQDVSEKAEGAEGPRCEKEKLLVGSALRLAVLT
jgi:hypothetical protein